MDQIAAGEIDDGEAAARRCVARGERGVQRQAAERPVLPGQAEADDGMAAGEGEAPRIARAEGDRLEPARRLIDIAELAGAGIEQPEPAVVQPRLMRH